MVINPFIDGTFPMNLYNNTTNQPTPESTPTPTPESTPTPTPKPPVTRGIDITLRIECRPCIHKLRKKNGMIVESLRYALIWTGGTNGPTLLGVAEEFINDVLIDYSHNSTLFSLGDVVEEEEEEEKK